MKSRALVLLVATVALSACPPKSTSGTNNAPPGSPAAKVDKSDALAKVGDTVITVDQVQRRLDEQSPFVRVRYTDPAKKKEFLDSQVRFEVLAAEAFARGLDKDPEVVDATKKIIVQKLTREEFDNRVKMQDVSDDDLKKYFDAHQADYQKPEMVRASDIAIAFGKDKAAAKKKADEAQKKASAEKAMKDPNAFKDLVTTYSTDDGTKRAGGDLRYLGTQEVEDKLGGAAKAWLFGAETIGEVSPVLESKDAFHVLKRTGKRKEISRTFEQVKNQIKNVVFREKRTDAFNAYVEELKKKHNVAVYENKLDEVKVNAQMPPPGADPHAALGQNGGFPPPPPSEENAERADHPREPGLPKIDPNDEGGEGKP